MARTVSADAAKELESPVKEVLEQVKKHTDMGCNGYMMRRAYYAERSGNWEGFKEKFRKTGEISEWAFAGVKEAHDKVASEDVGSEHRTGHLAKQHLLYWKRYSACVWSGGRDRVVRLPAL